jgi:hypothetical protein
VRRRDLAEDDHQDHREADAADDRKRLPGLLQPGRSAAGPRMARTAGTARSSRRGPEWPGGPGCPARPRGRGRSGRLGRRAVRLPP